MKILVVEPQCRGFEHAQFNAALLSTVKAAYPTASIEFWAEAQHKREVLLLRQRATESNHDIVLRDISVRVRRSAWTRSWDEARLVSAVLERANDCSAHAVIFASASGAIISATKLLAARSRVCRILAIPHSILCTLHRRSRRFWQWPTDLVTALQLRSPERFRAIALTDTIFEAVSASTNAGQWCRLDHPFLFAQHECDDPSRWSEPSMHLAILGSLRTLRAAYMHVAHRLERGQVPVALTAASSADCAFSRFESESGGIPRSSGPTSYEDYSAAAARCDGFLWIGDRQRHHYVASCTLIEILGYQKPAFLFRTPLVTEYERRFGVFGFVSETLDSLADSVTAYACSWPSVTVQPFLPAMSAARRELAPERVALQLKAAIDG